MANRLITGRWTSVLFRLIGDNATVRAEAELREQFAKTVGDRLAPGSVRSTFERSVHWLIQEDYARFAVGTGGARGIRLVDDTERKELALRKVLLQIEASEAQLAGLRTTLADMLKGE